MMLNLNKNELYDYFNLVMKKAIEEKDTSPLLNIFHSDLIKAELENWESVSTSYAPHHLINACVKYLKVKNIDEVLAAKDKLSGECGKLYVFTAKDKKQQEKILIFGTDLLTITDMWLELFKNIEREKNEKSE